MKLLDIHSHILPGVDDGSKSVEMSVELLKMMNEQGVTDVIATPHFDARYDNMEDFVEKVTNSYAALNTAVAGIDLPTVYTGAEVYYFKGIGKSYGAKNLALAGSGYILLELPHMTFDDSVIKDIEDLADIVGLVPILAHIERYADQRGFKKLLKLVSNGTALAQINAPSVFMPPFKRVTAKLIKKGYISFIATDTHSPDTRPPMLAQALSEVERLYGAHQKKVFLRNSDRLYNEIFEKD